MLALDVRWIAERVVLAPRAACVARTSWCQNIARAQEIRSEAQYLMILELKAKTD